MPASWLAGFICVRSAMSPAPPSPSIWPCGRPDGWPAMHGIGYHAHAAAPRAALGLHMPHESAANSPPDFAQLAEHREYLLRIARLELRDHHLAEDCVSDVLTHAYEKRASFRGASSLRTWLTAILKNRVIDLLRKQWREQPLEPSPSGEQDFDSLFDASGHYVNMPSEVNDPAELCQQDGFL